jgi:hypothetical protein
MRTYVALGITTIWAVSYIVSTLQSDYTGISLTTPVVLLACAYLLGAQGKDGHGR